MKPLLRLVLRMQPTERAEATASIASVFMAMGMITVAVASSSVSVLAEGIDTCVDIVTSIAVMIGLKLSKRHSRDFPHGLYKLENVVATAIGFLILFSAYELAKESIQRLTATQTTISDPWVAMGTMAVVVVITGLLAWNKARVGRAENSPSLIADAHHSWTDTTASAGVIVGVGLNAAGVPYVDSIMALVIVAILAWSGGQVIREAAKVLLDASIERDVIDAAARAAQAGPEVRRVVRVDGRNSGSYRFLHVTIVPQSFDVRDAEASTETIRESIKAAVQHVESVQVELVPDQADKLRVALLLQSNGRSIADDMRSADSYALLVIDPDEGMLDHTSILENPIGAGDPGRAIKLAVVLANHGADMLLVRGDVPAGGARYVLEANGMDIVRRPDLTTLDQTEQSAADLGRRGLTAAGRGPQAAS